MNAGKSKQIFHNRRLIRLGAQKEAVRRPSLQIDLKEQRFSDHPLSWTKDVQLRDDAIPDLSTDSEIFTALFGFITF
jgi:hypothetical protein